jgi:hypothetical protein
MGQRDKGMATGSQGAPGNQQYTVFGDGVINTGDNSQVNNAIGDGNRQSANYTVTSPSAMNPWDEVGKELARIRVLLESAVASAHRDDSIEWVCALSRDLPDLKQSGADGPKNLRQRIRALIGMLTPVAGLIGGVAALESIWQHL